MLTQLKIENIILIDSALIPLKKGLNVLSGETGSGKSAIIHSIALVLGERMDTQLIRCGCMEGRMEATFMPQRREKIQSLLEESGITWEEEEELIIKREIFLTGKSRAFINSQLVGLSLLKKIGVLLVDHVGQQGSQSLRQPSEHQHILDLFGGNLLLKQKVKDAFFEEKKRDEILQALLLKEKTRQERISRIQEEYEELSQASLKKGEEEALFTEYSLLSQADEIEKELAQVSYALSEGEDALLLSLTQVKKNLLDLAKKNEIFRKPAEEFQVALIEMEEVSYSLEKERSKIEKNPAKMEKISERLSLYKKIKKRVGGTVEDALHRLSELQDELSTLNSLETQIELAEKTLKSAQEHLFSLCKTLSEERQKAAVNLEKKMTQMLQSLNMTKATFHVRIKKKERSSSGDEEVEFLFTPNHNENTIPVAECASGGELSRILLALKTLIAGQEEIPTLLFDEIDAGIGGETASLIGQRLKEISTHHQIIAITHFPQVAKWADHHLQISKKEKGGRTTTEVVSLTEEERTLEIKRMIGVS